MQDTQIQICGSLDGINIDLLPLGWCTVYLAGTSTKAALFDSSGSPISNPVQADSNAVARFSAADGKYDFQFQNATLTYTAPKLYNQQVYDLSNIATTPLAITTRTALAALASPANLASYFLIEAGRAGRFIFSNANHSADITSDPQQGIFVPPAADTTGASGAWVRNFDGDLWANWFGLAASNTGAANKTAMDAAIAYHLASGLPLKVPPGPFFHTGAFTITGNYIDIQGAGWGETIFKPTTATESFILKSRYGKFARIGCDGQSTGTNGIVCRDCNDSIIDECSARNYTGQGLLLDPGYGGGAAGNNDFLRIAGGQYVLNGGCGLKMVQAADNNNVMILEVNCSSNTSHGMLLKNAGGYVSPGCDISGNGGYGIQIGEDTDAAVNLEWTINSPWLESNTSGGVHGSAKSAGNLVILKTDSNAGQGYSATAGALDCVRSLLNAYHRFGNDGVAWVALTANTATAFVSATNTTGTGNVDLRLQAQNSGVIRPQNDVDLASGKALKMNGVPAIDSSRNGSFANMTAIKTLFNDFTDAGNTTTTETDLYSHSIAAGQLAANGDKLKAEFGGNFVAHATATRELKLYFGGTAIFDTGALSTTTAETWTVDVTIIRVSSTVIRYKIDFFSTTSAGAALLPDVKVGELTGLTLSGANILKITGQAAATGAATNDIVAKLGCVRYEAAS